MKLRNFTPHPISIDIGDYPNVSGSSRITLQSEGVARVSETPGTLGVLEVTIGACLDIDRIPLVSPGIMGPVTGIPEPDKESILIVSALVASALAKEGRTEDIVSPGTGPQDGAIRDEKGQIVAVTRLRKVG